MQFLLGHPVNLHTSVPKSYPALWLHYPGLWPFAGGQNVPIHTYLLPNAHIIVANPKHLRTDVVTSTSRIPNQHVQQYQKTTGTRTWQAAKDN